MESSKNVAYADNCVTDYTVVISKHARRDCIKWVNLTWAYFSIIQVDTLAEEQPMHLFNLFASSKDALAAPKVL